MNVVICCRVSTKSQQETSIPTQDKLMREACDRGVYLKDGRHEKLVIISDDIPADMRTFRFKEGDVVKEYTGSGFCFHETAFDDAKRDKYGAMLEWIAANHVRLDIKALYFHKLDRAFRNATNLEAIFKWTDRTGVHVAFADHPWDLLTTAQGRQMAMIMVSTARYHSDNLSTSECPKGMETMFSSGRRNGPLVFGYLNRKPANELDLDRRRVVIHPQEGAAALKQFEWYADGLMVRGIEARLRAMGFKLSAHQIRENLANRFYIGEVSWKGRVAKGAHEPLVDIPLWDRVQARLAKRKRGMPAAVRASTKGVFTFDGGLIRARHPHEKVNDSAMTGEYRKSVGGQTYVYYRSRMVGGVKPIRWKADVLEEAVAKELDKLVFPDGFRAMFRDMLKEELAAESRFQETEQKNLRQHHETLKARQKTLMQKLLDGIVGNDAYKSHSDELAKELEESRVKIEAENLLGDMNYDLIAEAFELSQGLGAAYRVSNTAKKRRILEAVVRKLEVDSEVLYVEWLNPFNTLYGTPGRNRTFVNTGQLEPCLKAWRAWSPRQARVFVAAVS
jgi:site-specific DNA recombinase